jgi:hypothetical protein
VNGKIYAIGGVKSGGADHVSQVEEYDPATDTWTRVADIPTARSGVATSAVNGKIYAIGGWVGTGSPISTVEEYEPIAPLVVDFNGDGVVDFRDFCRLAQSWYGGESSADIAAGLSGEQSVDYEDLAGFVEYWLQNIGLIAHWKLDETEGAVAHDSIGGNDGYGTPDLLWRPDGGKVNGALELDGIDDFLFTTFSLSPAATSFSVFAWVKGGAAAEVIVSQGQGAHWLSTDPSGNFMTSLCEPVGGRFPPEPLVSESLISDGDWYRVGFTWDGSARVLYVDDVEVASDTLQQGLAGSKGTLYIGAASNLEAGTHWCGLIDDVRIYDRAIHP